MTYADMIDAELGQIRPVDLLEFDHLTRARDWVRSGAVLCRIAPPATPPMHLVSYFPVIDQEYVLLGDHISSGLWLPPGGHVETGEDPRDTVIRECAEELRMSARFVHPGPVFLTIAKTIGANPHEDVSLWYTLQGQAGLVPDYDRREYRRMRWFHFDDVPLDDTDPNLERFLGKLSERFVAA
ncbi:ADP-ribose pyrophosphatase YjhB (NUDIX family) [Roseinatronobacter thiooxidans]|uniref:ADP-ribose pyrophosphatase YjhB (NUDIX family) n=1 Tax=Roseinatronobacter thiooxidans TaxID=121821 RepID=A0A2W7PR65_9RHOB|nr:NUDIX domain-containing protein [Roseinatronobacter thiooxidans]PZX38006.1 ADP-ribose pyrophosphatase YjhB (NUDIX family) [Roseinatronobacter thiooxidans]